MKLAPPLLVLALVLLAAQPAQAAVKPNLVVFLCDDLGRLDISVHGAKDVRTPNMQKLAEQGLVFQQAFVASPSCAPSRAALLTGLMPARNGAEANHTMPRAEIKKLPAYLQELGYEVASFGKVAHYGHGSFYKFDVVQGEGVRNYPSIGLAAEYLKSRKSNIEKPLCIFVGTNWPHVPWPPETPDYDAASVIKLPPMHIDTPETRLARTRYLAAVTKADDDLGTILTVARETLDQKNTYYFFTSDHGGQWPFGKWNLYDAGIHVPLFVAGPGIKAGAKTDAMVSWIDILPTLVDLAGGQPPQEIDGRSFAPVIRGEKQTHRDEIYTTHSNDRDFNVYPIRSVRDGQWKYILNLHPEYQHATHINRDANGEGIVYFKTWEAAAKTDPEAASIVQRYKVRPKEELYDLSADPHEQNNLAADAKHSERLIAMRGKVEAWMKAQGDQVKVFDMPLLANQEATPLLPAAAREKAK